MTVRIKQRTFRPEFAAWLVDFVNDFGVHHFTTVHVAGHESCPTCGRPYQGGVKDPEAVIEAVRRELEEHEAKLRAGASKVKK
jgi:hypothetical protein